MKYMDMQAFVSVRKIAIIKIDRKDLPEQDLYAEYEKAINEKIEDGYELVETKPSAFYAELIKVRMDQQ